MPTGAGSFVRDATGPDLLTGATLTAGTTNGTVVDAQWPGDFSVYLATGTVTGTTPTLDVTVQAADNAAFDSGVVTLGQFELSGTAGAQSNIVRQARFYSNKRYLRTTVVAAGTSPVYTGTTAKLVPFYDRLSTGSTT